LAGEGTGCNSQWLSYIISVMKMNMAISMCMLLFSVHGHAQTVSPKTASDTEPLVSGKVSPVSQTIRYNTVPAQLTGTSPAGGNGTYSYQWQSSANGSTWINLPGANTLTYAPPSLTAITYYRLVSSGKGSRIINEIATVNIKNKN
jgi:hypothetical protein